jgi:hypothetical protein
MQFTGLPGARTALSGFILAKNTAKHSATMANVTQLKTCFISCFKTMLVTSTYFFDPSAASTAAGRIGR